VAVAAAVLERRAPRDHESRAGHALEAFPGRRDQRIEAHPSRIDGKCAVGAHRIDDEPASVLRHRRRDLRQRIQDARARLAVHLRDVRDRRIGAQSGIDPRRVGRLLLLMRQHHRLAAEITQDPHDALAVAAVVRHEHLGALRNERAERGFHGESTAALQRHTHVVVSAMDDIDDVATYGGGQRIECAIPRSPVLEHRGLGLRRGRQRPRSQQYRLAHAIPHRSSYKWGARQLATPPPDTRMPSSPGTMIRWTRCRRYLRLLRSSSAGATRQSRTRSRALRLGGWRCDRRGCADFGSKGAISRKRAGRSCERRSGAQLPTVLMRSLQRRRTLREMRSCLAT
jgi:hypothetical protein